MSGKLKYTDIITKDLLIQKYVKERLTQKQIANSFGVATKTILKYMKKYGIPAIISDAQYRENYFSEWSKSMSYILAFIICDAGIILSNKSYYVTIQLSAKDRSVIEFIRDEICPDRVIYEYESYTTGKVKQTKHNESCRLDIGNKKIVESLIRDFSIGPRKTGREILPDVPDKFKPYFLRGLIDGDGCFFYKEYPKNERSFRNSFRLYSASDKFLENVKNELLFGYGKIDGPYNNCYQLTVHKTKHIVEIGDYIYQDFTFGLTRKYEKFLVIKNHFEKKKEIL